MRQVSETCSLCRRREGKVDLFTFTRVLTVVDVRGSSSHFSRVPFTPSTTLTISKQQTA